MVHVHINGHNLRALLDTGSAHNFMNKEVSSQIGVPVSAARGLNVKVANGDKVSCASHVPAVNITIDKEAFDINCYAISLGGYDIVLGVAFLRTLGPILWDFDELCVAFWRAGHRVLWKGLGSPCVDPKGLATRTVRSADSGIMDRLLQSYSFLFEEPKGLPPARRCDHRIH